MSFLVVSGTAPHRPLASAPCSGGPLRLGGRVVMQRPAKPCTPVRFRPQPPQTRRRPRDGVSARVAEQVDARDLKSLGGDPVPVRVRPRAPIHFNSLPMDGQCASLTRRSHVEAMWRTVESGYPRRADRDQRAAGYQRPPLYPTRSRRISVE